MLRQFDPARTAALERRYGLSPGSIDAAAFDDPLLSRLVTGRLTRRAWARQVGVRIGSIDAAREWALQIGTPDPEMVDVLDVLREKGIGVSILTNGTDAIDAELATLDLRRHVDRVFNSAAIGVAKPDPRVYRHTLDALAIPPEEVLFVDDRPDNVEAALALGLHGHVFVGAAPCRDSLRGHGLQL